MSYNTAPDTIVRRHPIRGLLWGALLGIGIALHLLTFELVAFGTWPLLAAPIGGGSVVGFTWGKFGPVKKLKGRIPAALRGPSVHDDSPQARRAAQLAAARKAQADLQTYAKENADEAMCAALHEAQTDVLDSVTRRVGRISAARLATTSTPSPIAATASEPEPPTTAAQPGPHAAAVPADPVLEQLADHPAAQLGGFDHDLAAEAAALAAQFEEAWETTL